jgi:hypothetical protein
VVAAQGSPLRNTSQLNSKVSVLTHCQARMIADNLPYFRKAVRGGEQEAAGDYRRFPQQGYRSSTCA